MAQPATIQSKFDRAERCPKCGGKMHVTRRSPHPVIIKGEKQILTCHACGAQETRSVDESGEEIA
jgi:transcription elongation factor Elf1